MTPSIPLLSLFLVACEPIRSFVMGHYPSNYEPANIGATLTNAHWSDGVPTFTQKDAQRKQVGITLTPVLNSLNQPTDMVFFPDSNTTGFVLEKDGGLLQFDLATGKTTPLRRFDVLTTSEQGLIGVALHPEFTSNGTFYLHRSLNKDGEDVGEISSWRWEDSTVTPIGLK